MRKCNFLKKETVLLQYQAENKYFGCILLARDK